MRLTRFGNGIERFSKMCNGVSCIAVLAMMCIVCANVALRFMKAPILGTFEYVTLISSVLISFGLAHTMVIKGHVAVDLVMRRFSKRTQAIVDSIMSILALYVFGTVTWAVAKYAYQNFKNNVATETMEVPLYPFNFLVSFGLLIFLFVLLNEIILSITKAVQK